MTNNISENPLKSGMFLTKISQQRIELFKLLFDTSRNNYTTNHMYTTYNYTLIIAYYLHGTLLISWNITDNKVLMIK